MSNPQGPLLRILDFGPKTLRVGQRVNPQPDGSSAMWIRLTQPVGRLPLTVVFAPRHRIPVCVDGSDTVTAVIPPSLQSTPGYYPFYVTIESTRRKSDERVLIVEPAPD
ncbi:MAG TPA: hypothetical protein PLS90_12800 [Candidatus Sumerlaeota bacterium]|nr:hypothetical protein [Candidatus Sumerlaeota bacterium]HOR29261.1 hypothetical protein [Candidatus Sumerlaeota bacterium]HPK03325.1 hypothetical protein [Candidatus Sumerlaeota bacterium]